MSHGRAGDVYFASDAGATRTFLRILEERGPLGEIAAYLFRAQKASDRAKAYRGGTGTCSYRALAYARKQEAIGELCDILTKYAPPWPSSAPSAGKVDLLWGWKPDESTILNNAPSWVLYVDIEPGQVSFHSPTRGKGPGYPGEWDKVRGAAATRVVQFAQTVYERVESAQQATLF